MGKFKKIETSIDVVAHLGSIMMQKAIYKAIESSKSVGNIISINDLR